MTTNEENFKYCHQIMKEHSKSFHMPLTSCLNKNVKQYGDICSMSNYR